MKPHHPSHLRMTLWDSLMDSSAPFEYIKSLGYDDTIDLLTICFYMEHEPYMAEVETHLRSLFD